MSRPVRHRVRTAECVVTATYRSGRVRVTAARARIRFEDVDLEFDPAEWPPYRYDAHRLVVERLRVFYGDPSAVAFKLRLADGVQQAVVGVLRRAGLEPRELEYPDLGAGANRAVPDLGFRAYSFEPSDGAPEFPGYPAGRRLHLEHVEMFSELILAEVDAGRCSVREAVGLIQQLHKAHAQGVLL